MNRLLFNSRTWSQRDRLAWLEFFSQHRKYSYQVFFVAQADKMIDNQFRMLIEYEIKHRKVSSAGIWGKLLAAPFLGKLFVRVMYYYQMNERLGSEWFLLHKKDARLYDTNAVFQRTDSDIARVATDPSI